MCIIKGISFGGDFVDNIIKIDKLTYRYEDHFIFDKLSLDIERSKWITITGPNGSGKTTLIKILTGLIKTDADIIINGITINNIKEIRKNIGVIFSDIDNNFLCETIEDDIAFPLENLGLPNEEIKKRTNELANLLNIRYILDKSPNELSGGEKVKAALAIALSHKPRILIIDGILSTIDNESKQKIFEILKNFRDNGLTIINITEDLSESYLSDKLVVISNGTIALEGPPIKVMEYDKVLTKLGIKIPFEIELSIKLKLYGLIDDLYVDINKLVNVLWG